MHDEPEPIPIELVGPEPAPWLPARQFAWPPEPRSIRSLDVAIRLFTITAFSTLAAGAPFSAAYAANQSPGYGCFFYDYSSPSLGPRPYWPTFPFAFAATGLVSAS